MTVLILLDENKLSTRLSNITRALFETNGMETSAMNETFESCLSGENDSHEMGCKGKV